MTKSETVRDLQVWGYSTLKVWNWDLKTDAPPPPPPSHPPVSDAQALTVETLYFATIAIAGFV